MIYQSSRIYSNIGANNNYNKNNDSRVHEISAIPIRKVHIDNNNNGNNNKIFQ